MTRNRIRPASVLPLILGLGPGPVVRAQDPAPPPPVAPTATARPGEVATPQLQGPRFAARKARLAADRARLARELAELAVREYDEVTYREELAAARGELRRAEADLVRAQDRVDWVRMMTTSHYAQARLRLDEQAHLERARFDLERARIALDVLTWSTRDETLRALRAEAALAEADRASKEAAWARERAEEARLEARLDAS